MRDWKPIYIENSRIPIWLSYLAPISIGAITLGFLVISRNEMSEITKNHEAIHFQQYIETAFIGFVFIYFWDYLVQYIKLRNGTEAYQNIRAEREAYRNHEDFDYIQNRKRWAWLRDEDEEPNQIPNS